MPTADVVQRGLWGCSIVLQAALVLKIVEKNLFFGLQWFVAWMAAEVAFAMLLIWTPIESHLYLQVWSVAQPALCLLRIAAGWEVIRRSVDLRIDGQLTRYHAAGGLAIVASLALSVISLRIEKAVLRCSVFEYSIVLLNRAVWTSIAIVIAALFLVRTVRPLWSLDKNTVIHAALLTTLAAVETSRYLLAACSQGRYTITANVAGLALEILLFAIWIAWLRPENGTAYMQESGAT